MKGIKSKSTTAITPTDHHHHALDMHTDAGLFIAMTPAMIYDSKSTSTSTSTSTGLFVQLGNGEVVHPTSPNSIIFMLGDGASRWIGPHAKGSSCKFRSTPHGVDMTQAGMDANSKHAQKNNNDGMQRAWYGRMFMLPEEAIVADVGGTGVTYGQFMRMQLAKVQGVRIICLWSVVILLQCYYIRA